MRITIDTELQAIIVPESYYMQVDKLNEVIEEAGGESLDYTKYIKTCFEKAYNTQIVRQGDVAKMKGGKKRKPSKPGAKAVVNDTPAPETKPVQPAEGEKK